MTNIKKTAQQGFTLIELLVVIAIIGILAGVLFVAIDPKKQTDKATDSSIASTMGQIPLQAAIINATSFEVVCDGDNLSTDPTIQRLLTAIDNSATDDTILCGSSENNFAVAITGKVSEYCVDVSGLHKKVKGTKYSIGSTGAWKCTDTATE
jgi:type IV pilus assembly protein PilA